MASKAKGKDQHKDRNASKGEHSLEFYGMIHTPVGNWKRIPEAAVALGKEWNKLEQLPAWDPKQVKEKADVQAKSDETGIPVHVAELMALCFLTNAELGKAHRKYKGRVVLRGDNIKDKE